MTLWDTKEISALVLLIHLMVEKVGEGVEQEPSNSKYQNLQVYWHLTEHNECILPKVHSPLLTLLEIWLNFMAFFMSSLVVWKHHKYLLNLKSAWKIETALSLLFRQVSFSFLCLHSICKTKVEDKMYPSSTFYYQHSTCLLCLPLFFPPTFSNHKKFWPPSFVRLLLKM